MNCRSPNRVSLPFHTTERLVGWRGVQLFTDLSKGDGEATRYVVLSVEMAWKTFNLSRQGCMQITAQLMSEPPLRRKARRLNQANWTHKRLSIWCNTTAALSDLWLLIGNLRTERSGTQTRHPQYIRLETDGTSPVSKTRRPPGKGRENYVICKKGGMPHWPLAPQDVGISEERTVTIAINLLNSLGKERAK